MPPQVWRDQVEELLDDKKLWDGLQYIALGRESEQDVT